MPDWVMPSAVSAFVPIITSMCVFDRLTPYRLLPSGTVRVFAKPEPNAMWAAVDRKSVV